ncbi:hypothetical protein [Nostoc sp. CENA543]|uniref:hypothetical protein n=1 Tax=Nostoc sp. CENA543 TaxID=1869241 RepID=UPI000CCC94ED|nr:hypothetical protein [Nostoc sp. CENA543]
MGTGNWGLRTGEWGQGRQGRQGRIYFSTQHQLNAALPLTSLKIQHRLNAPLPLTSPAKRPASANSTG